MKKTIFLLISFMTFYNANVDAQKLIFDNLTWEQALIESQKTGKPIFLDAYTNWCRPCKKMEMEVFSKESVSNYFNQNFINLHYNMDKAEYSEVKKKYNITAYPTLLFVDGNGSVLNIAKGYLNETDLLNTGKIANNSTQNLIALEKRFTAGDCDLSCQKRLLLVKSKVGDGSHYRLIKNIIGKEKKWKTEDNLRIVFEFCNDTDNSIFEKLIKNKKDFYKLYGKEEVDTKINKLVALKESKFDGLEDGSLKRVYSLIYSRKQTEKKLSAYKIKSLRKNGDRKGFELACLDHYGKYKCKDPVELTDIAYAFYKVVDNPLSLERALYWSKRANKIEKDYLSLSTLAYLYSKLGDRRGVRKSAKKAIKFTEDKFEIEEMTKLIENNNRKRIFDMYSNQ